MANHSQQQAYKTKTVTIFHIGTIEKSLPPPTNRYSVYCLYYAFVEMPEYLHVP